ncbi:stalk domain-containing protein [Brevibacillus panacihumi]|uniref:stalk domain-containing protein n=1 Tax=Brevibacillus panacihumi TaxID=497735 RepID=UPI003CFEC73C
MVIRNSKIVSTALSVALVASMLATGGTVAAQGKTGVVSIQSATQQYKAVTVIIDGKVQQFPQSAVVMDGSTLVPLRGIFEALGAKVLWDATSHSVTATKGDTVIKLTVDQKIAYINDRAVELSVQAQTLNGSTMVPLRFVSEALGADVKWNGDTYTATITSASGSGQVVRGIRVQYGKHTYGSANQSQYDQVMGIVNKAVADAKSETNLPDYYLRYINGERPDNFPSGSSDARYLKLAEISIGQLVGAEATIDEISKAFQAVELASTLLQKVKDVGVGEPSSAYDALVGGITDCDASSHTYSAFFDSFGFSSAVLGGSNHADVFVKIHDSWFKYSSGTFTKVNLTKIPSSMVIFSQPTFDPEFERQ